MIWKFFLPGNSNRVCPVHRRGVLSRCRFFLVQDQVRGNGN